ncbi:TetR/AcrR family transcriptional regulator, partial [Streptomyces sp. NPDC057557]
PGRRRRRGVPGARAGRRARRPAPRAPPPPHDPEVLAATCEIALRLALSYALVPTSPGAEGEVAPLVREVVEWRPTG